MNKEVIALGIIAVIAVSGLAYFMQAETTGQITKYQYFGKYTYALLTPEEACSRLLGCKDGLSGIPTGRVDPFTHLTECKCQTYPHTGWFDRVRKFA